MRCSEIRFYAAILIIGLHTIGCYGLNFDEILQSAGDIISGSIKDGVNSLPSPKDIFEMDKNRLIGLPFNAVFSAINKVCSSEIASKTLRPRVKPDRSRIAFQLRTACNTYQYNILKAKELWSNPEFDPKKKVVIMATGWRNQANGSDTIAYLAKAYNCRGDVNFVAIDAANFVDTLYTWSALNTDEIGAEIAAGLVLLADIVPIENIHLIGHSLGAHIMGSAGRNFYYKTGKLLPRITGLDPANPCFNEGASLSGLMRGDADMVDVIHSDPGALGKRDPIGDVDFYPAGLNPLPNGCFDILCAHSRAWRYYGETVYPGNEYSFMGVRCDSLQHLKEGECPGTKYPMGYAVPHNLKGNYFLEVNSKQPHGKESNAKLWESQKECGVCKK